MRPFRICWICNSTTAFASRYGDVTTSQYRCLRLFFYFPLHVPYHISSCAHNNGNNNNNVDNNIDNIDIDNDNNIDHSGMDNVRNMVGSPIAGLDPQEMVDTRQLCNEINNMITDNRKGNPALTNFPRKINIAISGGRDDYAHTMINDIGLQPHAHPETGEVRIRLHASTTAEGCGVKNAYFFLADYVPATFQHSSS